MNKNITMKISLVAYSMILLFSCSKKTEKNNNLVKIKDEYTETVNTPTANVVFQYVSSGVEKKENVSGKNNGDGYLYFNTVIVLKSSETRTLVETAYLNFGIENDFRLIAGKDSISPAFCHRLIGNNKNTYSYIIAFPEPEFYKQEDVELFFDDQQLGVGKVNAMFKHQLFKSK